MYGSKIELRLSSAPTYYHKYPRFCRKFGFSPYAHPLVPFSNLSIHKSFYLSFLNLEKYLFIKLHFVVILSNITPSPQDKLCLSNKTTLRYNIFNNILNAEPSIVPFFIIFLMNSFFYLL